MTEARSPSGRQLPVLALDVVDDRRAGPAQQRRDNEPDALPAAGRGKSHDMLGAVVAQIAAVLAADKDTRLARQASPIDLAVGRPARRTLGRDVALLARPPRWETRRVGKGWVRTVWSRG